jgi:hypothetical protein
MEVHEYTADQVAALRALFSHSVEEDRSVLYHSTSSVAEDEIDRNGLKASSKNDKDLLRVI